MSAGWQVFRSPHSQAPLGNVVSALGRRQVTDIGGETAASVTSSQITGSLHLGQELLDIHTGILQGPFESAAVHLIVKGKDDPSAVRMLQFDLAPSSMEFGEPEALQGLQNLATEQERKFHRANSTISRSAVGSTSPDSGSRYRAIASRMLANASSRVLP